MRFTKREPRASAVPQAHYGFNERGSAFASPTPVTNAMTNITRELIAAVGAELLPPAGVILALTPKPEFYRKAWPLVDVAIWGGLDSFEDWPVAPASTAMLQCIKNRGRAVPPWLLPDVSEWVNECARWRERSGGHTAPNHAHDAIQERLEASGWK